MFLNYNYNKNYNKNYNVNENIIIQKNNLHNNTMILIKPKLLVVNYIKDNDFFSKIIGYNVINKLS
jgi:hypothetical protein